MRLTTYHEYRRAVLAIAPMAACDARELAWLSWKGDRDAKRELIERHLWMVVEAAERLRPWQVQSFESLVSVGNRSLMRAVECYQPWNGQELQEHIRGHLLVEMMKEALPVV